MKLEVKDVSFKYGTHRVLENVSLEVETGEVLCLLGPNGVGKTTLFRSMLGFITPESGTVMIDGEDIHKWNNRKLARTVAYVPQAHTPPFAYSVLDVVIMGRNSHFSSFSIPSEQDKNIACEALNGLGILHLKDRVYTQISGGERQMVLIARALAQQASFFIMDEPTANLDFGNQVKLLRQIKELKKHGLGVIMSTHLPDQAFSCATKVALMMRNGTITSGTPEDVITEENLLKVYSANIIIIQGLSDKKEVIRSCVPII